MGIDFRWTNDPGGLCDGVRLTRACSSSTNAGKESSIYNILASLLPSDSFMHRLSVSWPVCVCALPGAALRESEGEQLHPLLRSVHDSSNPTVSSSTFTSY